MKSPLLVLCLANLATGSPAATSWELRTPVWRLSFGVVEGRPVITGMQALTATGESGPDWAPDGPEVVLPQTVTVDGQVHTLEWKWTGVTATPRELLFTYRSAAPALECVSAWQSIAGHAPIEHAVTLSNQGDQALQFSPGWSIEFRVTAARARQLTWVEQPGRIPSAEGTHVEVPAKGFSRHLLSSPNSTRDAVPWFDLADPAGGFGMYGGIEFSGLTEVLVQYEEGAEGRLRVALGLRQTPVPPMTRILPGGTFSLPVCFLGLYRGNSEEGGAQLHRWVEAHLRPATTRPLPGLFVNTWGGSGFGINEAMARQYIDDAQALGIEVFEVDAGWYRGVGDWHADPKKFPGGIKALSDYAHAKGLRFGLWLSWGLGGGARGSDAGVLSVFNPLQREWFNTDYPDDWRQKVPWEGAPLCLGSAAARAWCFGDLSRVVRDYQIDVLRQDQVMIVESCKRAGHDHLPCGPDSPDDRGTAASWDPFQKRQTAEAVDVCAAAARGYYEVYDRLRGQHPHLLFEGCNGGSHILDFGYLKRVHFFQVDDTYEPLSNRQSFYDVSHAVPPAMIMQWVVDKAPGPSVANFKYMLRSGMAGTCTILQNTIGWPPDKREAAQALFRAYTNTLRPLIVSARLYRVLPRPDGKRWDGVQYHDSGNGRGALLVFRPDSAEATQTIRLRGLERELTYRVTSADGSVSNATFRGEALMTGGLSVTLPEPFSSDCITIERVPAETKAR
jgi:hypothetical protein